MTRKEQKMMELCEHLKDNVPGTKWQNWLLNSVVAAEIIVLLLKKVLIIVAMVAAVTVLIFGVVWVITVAKVL